ncbi:response regulator transcription factor [Hoyosella subflava]|uniref:Putative OmpR family two-component response regulator n=1 Tax=Hoyosella subflava (strain DSM 45089 / JCM 17490 / NBRC 109087 / DQS3-9A1) TaxID=443218 RepID=F6ERZ7_HOYSD|nr:response regulator transcription factor [Hoyosella subflava]AEF40812.1 Putative OmpR family two-component response regulator [Hoyosella subflava DQS3-9A1]
MRVAVVEDDDGVGDALVDALTARSHNATRMQRGEDLLLHHKGFDAVLLDLGLPDADGLVILRNLRAVSDVPVIILTARDDERSVVRGLRIGADDYLVKPPRLNELVARLEVVTRRRRSEPDIAPEFVTVDDVRVDFTARVATVAGEDAGLTSKEFDLLAALAGRPGEAVSRQQLMDEIWGDAYVAISRTLDVHMNGLRSKLNRPGLIATIRGYGYRWGH